MTKRKILFAFLILATSVLGSAFFSSASAYADCWSAYSVNDPGEGLPWAYDSFSDTYAAQYACNQSGQGPYGVMVLSKPVSGGVPSGGGTMYVNAYVDGDGPAKQYFYVTGGFYNKSNTSWTGNVWGWDVELKTENASGSWVDQGIITNDDIPSSSSQLCYPSTGNCSYYTIGKYVYRGYKDKTKDRWFFGTDYTIEIDRDAFYDESRSGLHDLGNGLVYRTFGMHRCWAQSPAESGVASSTYHNSCGWADARLYGKKRIAQTNYSGSSSIEVGSSTISNNTNETIHSESKTYKFIHKVKRADDGDNQADNECYKVNTNVSGKGRSETCRDFNKNEEKTVHDPSITVSLDPGASAVVYQDLRFQPSNRDDGYSGKPSQNCTLSGYEANGRVCLKASRPYAKFTGSVTPSVTSTDGGTNYTISGGRAKITSSNGSFKIKFINRVNRNNDGAGGTVNSPWDTRATKAGAQLDANNDKIGLTEGNGSNVKTYEYTGTLRYGEEITYCSYLNYTHTVTGTAKSPASSCVTVYRENAKCSFATSFTYGLNNAVNTGRIGVRNANLATSPTYTTPNSALPVSIYARPTDQIKFYYDMCAGVVYPIKERGLSTEVTYKATGSSSKSSASGNKYLFGEQITSVNSYSNPKTWSSKATSGFMSNVNNIEANNVQSPSSGAGTNYRCGTSVSSGWYQVAGKADANGNEACARTGNYNIGVIDVGSTITQKLDWNEQTYNNGSFGNTPRTATANVIVPYNYVLKPFVTNDSAADRVAYLGETIHMTPGVVVAARKNTEVNSSIYATITKKTSIRVEYYYTNSAGTMINSPTVIYSKNNVRLNNDVNNASDLAGNGNKGDKYIEAGGTKLNGGASGTFSVPVSDSSLVPGDRVCMRIRVWPADSHDNPGAASVGASNTALQESGAGESSARATVSCLTVAKRPTISVESSNVYSATSITTSQFNKDLSSTQFRFGSWSEYGVFARVKTGAFIMASGAAFGYNRGGYKDSSGNWISTLNVTRTNPSGSADIATGDNSGTCVYMTQTFANANCAAGTKNIGGVAADQFSDRMTERYSTGSTNTVSVPTKTIGGHSYLNLSGYSDGGVVDDSGAIVIRPSGNAYINGSWKPTIPDSVFAEKGIVSRNNTVVYSLPGKTLVIDGNINRQSGSLSSNGQASGVVIIADKVLISSNATYINATIVANEVNTCAFKSDGSAISFNDLKWTGSSDYACAKSLQFDAPVSTKKIILNRTAGATNGSGSIVRAEVFNYNAAQLLWSYNQMSRYNQAITTYSRELPPRY
ncbi:hypothetical protein IK110_03830 [Candidatus Saccharibacteria bacterium]|nr:hypothetical protein [Candidatus Saccharibacteria bacterium]